LDAINFELINPRASEPDYFGQAVEKEKPEIYTFLAFPGDEGIVHRRCDQIDMHYYYQTEEVRSHHDGVN
jgi:hypothetical protein